MVITLGQQYNVGDKPTVILYTYINRHAGTPTKGNTKTNTSSNNKDKSNTIIETSTADFEGSLQVIDDVKDLKFTARQLTFMKAGV